MGLNYYIMRHTQNRISKGLTLPANQDASSPPFNAKHAPFIQQGSMVAFTLCFPGVTVPITPDESRITALALDHNQCLYGATSGHASHLFVALFTGATGAVIDLGSLPAATQSPGLCCDHEKIIVAANGPQGPTLFTRPLEPLPHWDLLQEWDFQRQPFTQWTLPVDSEPILHLVLDTHTAQAVGVTSGHIFLLDTTAGDARIIAQGDWTGRLLLTPDHTVIGRNGCDNLWRYSILDDQFTPECLPLPPGSWKRPSLFWAQDTTQDLAYLADDQGRLFTFHPDRGFSYVVAQLPLNPPGPMAVTNDGRLFGFCGHDLATMFAYTPQTASIADLGKAVSVIHRRRYGFQFADAVTGRDGQIFFAENDNFGHLWIYFPAIRPHIPLSPE